MFFNIIMNIENEHGVLYDAITVDRDGAHAIANEVVSNGGRVLYVHNEIVALPLSL